MKVPLWRGLLWYYWFLLAMLIVILLWAWSR